VGGVREMTDLRPHLLARLSMRYWQQRPGRAVVSLSGIALGIALMVAVVSVNHTVVRTYDGWAAAIRGRSQVEVRSVESAGLSGSWAERVRGLPGVTAVAEVVEQRSYLFTETTQSSVALRGIDPAAGSPARWEAVEGRALVEGDHDVVSLSQAAAESLDVGLGGTVSLLTTVGVVELRVIGIHQARDEGIPPRDRSALIPLADAQVAFMHGRDALSGFDVEASDVALLGSLTTELEELFGAGATISLPTDELRDLMAASRGLRFLLLLSGAMALVAAAFLIATNLFAAVEERGHDLTVLRAIGLPGATAGAWLVLESAALGLVGSVIGAGAGAATAGAVLARVPSALLGGADMLPRSAMPAALVVLGGVAIGVAVAVVASWPLVRRVSAEAAFGPSERQAASWSRPKEGGGRRSFALSVGAVLVVAGALAYALYGAPSAGRLGRSPLTTAQAEAAAMMLLVLALGWAAVRSFPLLLGGLGEGVRHLPAPPVWLRLATDSLRRHSRRSGATAISLMITVAGLVGVYGAADSYRHSLVSWLDQTVAWDLLVSSGTEARGSSTPLPAQTAEVVASVDGVLSALPERTVTVSSAGRAVQLVAFDAQADEPSRRLRVERAAPGWQDVSMGDALGSAAAVAITTPLAARLGLAPGDRLPVSTMTGETSLLVVSVVEDPAADGAGSSAAAYVDLDTFALTWNDHTIDEIGVRLDPGVDPHRASTAVAAAVRHALSGGANSRAALSLDPGHEATTQAGGGPTRQSSGAVEPAGADTDAGVVGAGNVPVQVIHAGAYREEVLDGVRDTFAVTRTLVLLAVLVAMAGLLNAMLIGFWQLRHQLGLLRALGAPVKVLARTLAAEAALTAVAGGGAGVLLGTLLSLAFLRGMAHGPGPQLAWSPPLQAYVTVAALLAAAAVVAASLLADRARATPVQVVVRGE